MINKQVEIFDSTTISLFSRNTKMYGSQYEQWLVKKRLQEAKEMLQNKNKSVSNVYMEVGFKNFSHFSTAFKKQYGVAPSNLE